ncbi:hypothetical protein LP421_16810 [Rhizobium sp. RCAM05350]|nr:hypothetical protein LP421_16810 [Rhizobium sp. RCAM05350]
MEFDARFDALWGRVKSTKAIWNWRDSEMLTWRFLKNPVNKYRIAVAADNSEIRGYIVVKQYLSSDLDIVDIVADDKKALPPLVAWAAQVARDMSLSKANIWASIGADHRESIARRLPGGSAGHPFWWSSLASDRCRFLRPAAVAL